MDDRILKFLREIDNQLSHAADVTRHETSQAGLVSLQTEGHDYFVGLTELKDQILNSIRSCTPWAVLTLPDTVPPWKLLAFSRSSGSFLEPEHLLKRYRELHEVVKRQDTSSNNDNHAQMIWESKDLEHWVTTDRSFMIFLESALPFNLHLERFLLELITHLSQHHPVVHILDLPPIPEFGALGAPTPQVVLEHLTTHVLQFLSPQMSLQCIAETLTSFERLQNLQEWFEFLLQSCKTIPRITIVVDMRILRSFSEVVHSWPSIFAKSTARLNSTSQSCLKVMFVMSSVQSFPYLENAPVVSVGNLNGNAYWSSPFPKLSVPRPMKPHPKPPSTTKWSRTEVIMSLSTQSEDEKPAETLLEKAADSHEYNVWKGGQFGPTPVSGSVQSARAPSVPPKTSDDIRIAILCALTLEANAMEALFDYHWDDVDKSRLKALGDKNSYTFGILGGHQTVLAYMPGMGKASGAMVASHCSSSFRKVALTLLVGVCGGVPFYTQDGVSQELILGDVIIGEEIVIHDFGRQYPEGLARKKGSRDVPGRLPSEARSLLSQLKGVRHMERLRERTYSHLRLLMDKHSNLVCYPGAERDRLFEGTYRHKHHGPNSCAVCSSLRDRSVVCYGARDSACEELGCDESRTIRRERLRNPVSNPMLSRSAQFFPVIHFGSIASGDQVMKSGEDRDRMARSEDILAFEMEAAGVCDVVSCCLVIKGVCDYADSHKNKDWQKYAAATAAACTKAFLQEWSIID
ncbi:pfs domain-containing protein [Colletotrichum salicis]|uniref:Pfs domain-containing protein n=1 Tax=Colletotrichum salicis TaxID=1209931 RepID=A0A135UKV4_9PEZI|nr:pfs domain-containing protein [Colletotrichum salicis]